MKIKYINNKILHGIEYDYNLINKQFKKMLKECHAPGGLYDVAQLPLDVSSVKYFALMSERSSSKTTQLMLYCMVINKLYGSRFSYLRRLKEQISKQAYERLFDVILDKNYGYIEWLTDKKYNSIVVDRTTKECKYCKRDESGKIIEEDNREFMTLMSVDNSERYTSAFNVTDYDHIIFDEFSRGGYKDGEFLQFQNIIATLRRGRLALRIFLLSNTISPYNQYLKELCIASVFAKMKKGQHQIYTTQLGARVYCELLDVQMHQSVEFKASALEYHGFDNEGLRSLYGGEWEIKGFRHLKHSGTRTTRHTNVVLNSYGNNLNVLMFRDGKQNGVLITPRSNPVIHKNIIISDNPQYNTDIIEVKRNPFIMRLKSLDAMGLLYFSDNETALQYYNLIDTIKI